MVSEAASSDPVLATLAGSRQPVIVMSRLAITGLCFWVFIAAVMVLGAYGRVAEGSQSVPFAVIGWSLIGVPVLLHIWPILALRRTAKALGALAAAPSEASAVIAARAQRLYWKTAALCHLAIVAWWTLAFIGLYLMVAWENSQPQTFRILDVPR